MMAARTIIDALRAEKTKAEISVINGQLTDWPSYRFCVARIQAFQDAIDIISNILNEEDKR
jgi:hypothetical protein